MLRPWEVCISLTFWVVLERDCESLPLELLDWSDLTLRLLSAVFALRGDLPAEGMAFWLRENFYNYIIKQTKKIQETINVDELMAQI